MTESEARQQFNKLSPAEQSKYGGTRNAPDAISAWQSDNPGLQPGQGGGNVQVSNSATPYDGMPMYPELKSRLNGSGVLEGPLHIVENDPIKERNSLGDITSRLNNINLDTSGVEQLKKEALAAPGTSAWEGMMRGRQGLEESGAQDNAARTSASGTAQAMSQLSGTGGLSNGARERLARMGGQDLSTQKQSVLRQGQLDRSGIGVQAEQNRLGQLSQLPGAQIAALQPEIQKTQMYGNFAEQENQRNQDLGLANRKYSGDIQAQNIGNSLNTANSENAARLGAYNSAMQAWAANKQAGATQSSGKK